MATLSTDDRKHLRSNEFAGPGRTYPIPDDSHADAAIRDSAHAEHVGNISKSTEESIDAKAHAKLREDGKDGDATIDHKEAVSKMHPEHVHRLVKAAADGQFGPEAKATAQKAMASPVNSARQIFGAPDDDDDNDSPDDSAGTPIDARGIFGGSGR